MYTARGVHHAYTHSQGEDGASHTPSREEHRRASESWLEPGWG